MSEQDKKLQDFGTIAGIVIVVIVLLVGAVYFFEQRIQKQQEINNLQTVQNNEVAGATDTVENIANDAAAVDTNSLGDGIDQLK